MAHSPRCEAQSLLWPFTNVAAFVYLLPFFYCILAVLTNFWLLVFVFVAILIIKAHGTYSFLCLNVFFQLARICRLKETRCCFFAGFFFCLVCSKRQSLETARSSLPSGQKWWLAWFVEFQMKANSAEPQCDFSVASGFSLFALFFPSPLPQRKSTTVPVSFYFTVATVAFGLLSAQCWTGKHFFRFWVVASGCKKACLFLTHLACRPHSKTSLEFLPKVGWYSLTLRENAENQRFMTLLLFCE